MDTTHYVGTFLFLLEWFSEAQILYPKISNDKGVGCLLSDSRKKQILWNYAFNIFEDEIHNMNKNQYGDFYTCTEAKSAFILAEERKSSEMKKRSETKKSNDNSSGAANAGNNKNKDSNQKKKHQRSNTNSRVTKNLSMKCTYCGQYGRFSIKCFKYPQGGSYKGKPENSTGGKER